MSVLLAAEKSDVGAINIKDAGIGRACRLLASARVAGLATFSALSLFFLTSPAQAADCGPLVQESSLDMTPLPGSSRMAVPVSVNGATEHLLLATGAGATSLTAAAGKALGLHYSFDNDNTLLDLDGYASHHYFRLNTLRIGDLDGGKEIVRDTPDPHAGINPPFDGMLAADLFNTFDIEIDFAARKLIFFSPDHCPGRVVHWPATVIGEAPIALRARYHDAEAAAAHARVTYSVPAPGHPGSAKLCCYSDSGPTPSPILGTDIRTTVTLDGKTFTANIDTGKEISTLNTDDARAAFDVTAETPGSVPATSQGEDDARKPAEGLSAIETVNVYGERNGFLHSFHTLSFGGVTVNNPRFLVRPDQTGAHDSSNQFVTGSRLVKVDDFPRPQITIGMDVLRQLHLYFAFKEGKLYATPAGAPQAPSSPTAPPA